ncbi:MULTISPECIES: hypothetical protein [Bacteria]|uniref:hypothetical protein n=1 Tax=Bacteria TaxID=2 RepID=UPI003C7AC027
MSGEGPQPERFARLPTVPTPLSPESGSDVAEGAFVRDAAWTPSDGSELRPRPEARLAPWALLAAVVALVASFFVGWGIPLGILAVIAAILSIRRPAESRGMSLWALVLALVSCLYSLGWLAWAAYGSGLFGS